MGLFILSAALVGCATAPAPIGELETTAAAIRAAREVGAAGIPQAALHLQLAKEQSDQAKELLANNQPERASFVLLRAQADAELAVALARDNDMRVQAQQAADRLRALSQSTQGSP
jgi:hypothetical protein